MTGPEMTKIRTSAIITGAAMGIGRAVAEALAARDIDLVLVDLAEAPLTKVAESLRDTGVGVEVIVGSTADEATANRAVEAAERAFGGLNMLSHNAGIQRYG